MNSRRRRRATSSYVSRSMLFLAFCSVLVRSNSRRRFAVSASYSPPTVVCYKDSRCIETYSQSVEESEWPNLPKGILKLYLDKALETLSSQDNKDIAAAAAAVGEERRERRERNIIEFYIQTDESAKLVLDLYPGIVVSFSKVHTYKDVTQWINSTDKLWSNDADKRRLFYLNSPLTEDISVSSWDTKLWFETDGFRVVYSFDEPEIPFRVRRILKEFKDAVRSLNARLKLPQLKFPLVDSLKVQVEHQRGKARRVIRFVARSVMFNSESPEGAAAAPFGRLSMLALTGQGKQREFEASVYFPESMNNCQLELVSVFPGETSINKEVLEMRANSEENKSLHSQYKQLSVVPSGQPRFPVLYQQYKNVSKSKFSTFVPIELCESSWSSSCLLKEYYFWSPTIRASCFAKDTSDLAATTVLFTLEPSQIPFVRSKSLLVSHSNKNVSILKSVAVFAMVLVLSVFTYLLRRYRKTRED